jgi:hypothetical protein
MARNDQKLFSRLLTAISRIDRVQMRCWRVDRASFAFEINSSMKCLLQERATYDRLYIFIRVGDGYQKIVIIENIRIRQ